MLKITPTSPSLIFISPFLEDNIQIRKNVINMFIHINIIFNLSDVYCYFCLIYTQCVKYLKIK